MSPASSAPTSAAHPADGADRYVVIGHPVTHSQSPFIHAEFARACGQRLVYDRLDSPLDAFAATVRDFAAGRGAPAGAGPARGCNNTVPFKFEVLALAARATPRAALAQAANVLRFDADGWLADNSDGIGLLRDITEAAGTPVTGRRVLLIGAGGAAAGVLGPLLEAGAAELTLANRTVDKADALVARHAALAEAHRCTLRATALDAAGEGYDIVINGSASSLGGAGVPVGPQVLGAGALAIDMMYGAAARPFLDWAQAHGARGRDGLGMLVFQAAEAFALWRGVRPDPLPVLQALRERLAAQA
ncbi:MAG: hypothetical protein RLY78_4378 [Pseudomonadota bacterium]